MGGSRGKCGFLVEGPVVRLPTTATSQEVRHARPGARRRSAGMRSGWESRFGAVPLLDQEALLACSGYVDLNPIRAGKADTPAASEYTSAYQRIQERVREGKELLERVDAMLPKLIDRFDSED